MQPAAPTHDTLVSIHLHALKLLTTLGTRLGPDQDMLAILDRARAAVTQRMGPDHGKVVISVRLKPSLSERYDLWIGMADDPERPAWTYPAGKGVAWTDLEAAKRYAEARREYQSLRVQALKGAKTATDEECVMALAEIDHATAETMALMRRLVTQHQEPMTVLHA